MVAGFAGCATKQPKVQIDNTAGIADLPTYSGPKARVTVADFEVKAAKAGGEISSGLREMLVTALVNSNRFNVVERQALSAAKAADLIIAVTVTEFEPQSSGGRAGIGGGGGIGNGVLGTLLGGALNKAHMALDIRIVNTSTSGVLAAKPVQGQASDISGSIMTGFFGHWGLGAGLSAYANTPMEKAIRVCIAEAVRYLAKTIPASYYKY